MYDGADIFEYRLVPLYPDVPPISHRNNNKDISGGKSDDTAGVSVYSYPFDTLPPILSRVKPHFVVYDAGRKLDLISNKGCTTPPAMARIYGVSQEKASLARTVVLQTYRTWNRPAHPATFVTSPRANDSRSRSGLIKPGQSSSASQGAGRLKKRVRTTGKAVDTTCLQPNQVRYATSLSRVSACGPDVSMVGDSGWDTEVNAEFAKTQLRRVIKVSKRWVRDCERAAQSSGGWVACGADDEQVISYRREPSRRMLLTM